MTPPQILTNGSVHTFRSLIVEAEKEVGVSLAACEEAHLVTVLRERIRLTDEDLFRPVALELSEVTSSQGFLLIGNRCLLLTGMFPGYNKRKGLSDEYLEWIGASAYKQAEYENIANAFRQLRTVLSAVKKDAPPLLVSS